MTSFSALRTTARAATACLAFCVLASPAGAHAAAPPAGLEVSVHAECNGTPAEGVEVWAGAAAGKFHNSWGVTDQAGNLTVTGLPAGVFAPIGWTYNGHSDQMGMLDSASHQFGVEVCGPRIVFTAVDCAGQPAPGVTLWAGVGRPTNGGQFDLGLTDDAGRLDVKQDGLVGLAAGYRTPDGGWVATVNPIDATDHALTIHVCAQPSVPSGDTGQMPAAGSASGVVAMFATILVAAGAIAVFASRRRADA